jgi:hypothetical protein
VKFEETIVTLRLWLYAAALRPLKRVVPFETLVRLMNRRPSARPSSRLSSQLQRCMDRTGRFPFRPPSNCLERSLGAYRMLCGAGASPELFIGVRRVPGRVVQGHVWVTVAGRALAERSEDLSTYTTIAWFDANGCRHAAETTGTLLAGISLQ